ncbi:hypothetical protein FOXYSP1_00468 [Fusarium oxysporum f. sp. phaseoli]
MLIHQSQRTHMPSVVLVAFIFPTCACRSVVYCRPPFRANPTMQHASLSDKDALRPTIFSGIGLDFSGCKGCSSATVLGSERRTGSLTP